MADKKKLLVVRKEKKAKKPTFVKHAAHRKKKLEEGKWRKPRGLQNKLRLNKKSRGRSVRNGYRGPVAVRGLTQAGKKSIVIATKQEIVAAEPETHDIIIAGGLGNKKRLMLIEEAKRQGFTIINLDADKKVAEIKNSLEKRKKDRVDRTSKKAERDKKIEAKAKKAEEKKKEEEKLATELSDEDKKKAEKKAQEKILTKKDQ